MEEQRQNIMYVISHDNLKELAVELAEHIRSLFSDTDLGSESKLLTAEEVANKYNISKTSLWRWAKNGYLQPTQLGKKKFYRACDIDELLNL